MNDHEIKTKMATIQARINSDEFKEKLCVDINKQRRRARRQMRAYAVAVSVVVGLIACQILKPVLTGWELPVASGLIGGVAGIPALIIWAYFSQARVDQSIYRIAWQHIASEFPELEQMITDKFISDVSFRLFVDFRND